MSQQPAKHVAVLPPSLTPGDKSMWQFAKMDNWKKELANDDESVEKEQKWQGRKGSLNQT